MNTPKIGRKKLPKSQRTLRNINVDKEIGADGPDVDVDFDDVDYVDEEDDLDR